MFNAPLACRCSLLSSAPPPPTAASAPSAAAHAACAKALQTPTVFIHITHLHILVILISPRSPRPFFSLQGCLLPLKKLAALLDRHMVVHRLCQIMLLRWLIWLCLMHGSTLGWEQVLQTDASLPTSLSLCSCRVEGNLGQLKNNLGR